MNEFQQKIISALEPYGLKSEGSGKWRCKSSPFRAGSSDSNAFTIELEGESGLWCDHADGQRGGNFEQLARHFGIDLPDRREVASTKRAYKSLAEYAESHGINDEILKAAGWRQVVYQDRPAIEFTTKGGKRWRFLDDQKPHYKSQQGYQRCWYGLDQSLLKHLVDGKPLVICNGEISTITARAYFIAACCVTAGENANLPKALIEELKSFTQHIEDLRIIVALDCDNAGRKAGTELVTLLQTNGFGSVKAVDLGFGKGGDLADFCMLHDMAAAEKILTLPELKQELPHVHRQRWQIIHARELANLPPISWLIKPEIPDKSITVIYGPSGVGKSFVVLDYAMQVARSKPVIYMAGEGETGYRARIAAWMRHHGRDEGKLYMCLGAVSLLDEGDTGAFVEQARAITQKPALIVIDTLARSMLGGDENSARDMGLFIDRCDMIRAEFDCGVIIVHHTNKGGAVERGSNSLRGAAESMIKISDEDDLIVVECAKSKDAQPFPTRYMRLLPVDIGLTDSDGNMLMPPVAIPTERGAIFTTSADGLTRNQRKVLETCGLGVFEYGFTVAEINEMIPDMDRGGIVRVFSALKRMNYIHQDAKREPYTLTPKARDLLGLESVESHDSHDSHESVESRQKNKGKSLFEKHDDSTDSTDSTDSSKFEKRADKKQQNDSTDSKKNKKGFSGTLPGFDHRNKGVMD